MVDRVTEYFGALVRETDGLQSQQNQMVGLGYALQSALGTATAVDGFTCTPTTPSASLSVIVTPGSVMQTQSLEATTWSSLPANTATTIVKQGLLYVNDVIAFTPPGTTGYSQNFLIEVQYADLDTSPVLLPYYNAATPTIPFNGPAGSGTSQNTARLGIASIQVKAGTAATSGTQATPTPDAGWTGLFVVTLANGATTITSGNITTYSLAPFIPVKLPTVPAGVQSNKWASALDVSVTANALSVPINPTPTSLPFGMYVTTKVLTTNTGPTTMNVGTGALAVIYSNGSAMLGGELNAGRTIDLVFNGTAWEWQGQQAPILQQALTLYVNFATGSDSNNGLTTGTAFKTVQAALTTAAGINGNGKTLTIQLADSASYPSFSVTSAFNGSLTIRGNPTTPANVVITGTGTNSAAVSATANVILSGMTLQNSGTAAAHCLAVANNAIVTFGAGMVFGSCVNGNHMNIDTGRVAVTFVYAVNGNAQNHINITYGQILLTPSTTGAITISGAALSGYFMVAADLSYARVANVSFSGSFSSGTK